MTITGSTQAPDPAQWPPPAAERSAAGRTLIEWAATTGAGLPRLCLLRGGRSSGKSHLLAWFLTGAASHPATTAHATVPAQGLITDAVAWEMGRQLGYGPVPPHRLLERVAADQRPLLLLLPDLHLAGRGPSDQPAGDPQTIVDAFVLPLLQLPHVRAVVETGETTLLADQEHQEIDLGALPFPGIERPDDIPIGFAALRATIPATADGRPIWSQAPHPSLVRILDAAIDAGDSRAVSSLLADPGFLLHGPAAAITAALRSPATAAPAGLRPLWERAAPQLSAVEHSVPERAALLHAAALGVSHSLSEYLRPLAEQHQWSAVWAQHGRPTAAQVHLPQGGGLLLSDLLGRLYVHDPATGHRTGTLPAPAALRPCGIAASSSDALLILDETGPLHAVTADEDGPAATVLGHIASHHGQASLTADSHRPTAIGGCPHSSLAAIGDAYGAVHLWSLGEYRPMPRSCRLHTAPVTAVACLRGPEDDLTFVISGALDGSLRLWETSQAPMENPLDQRPALITALAAASTPAGPVLAAAWNDQEIHLWHLLSGTVRVLPLLSRCTSLAFTPTGQLTVGGPDGFHAIRLDLGQLWAQAH
ncbi:hypothetical protein SSP35_15_00210 [Streptomyces sp. NBRC 110611]|uniref:WD40 repeat domain-containing protein n=1 Tax=Streptomyces sp. NBRC 110611 TaxID=1621259 RepID=UPI00082FEAB7|nr:hypothetical protein [Streptomyces sp. NBRC 110611]GAU69866.1 hypothetical protein SSP35_15_00210 [Streptomyces sp. NBRC 110611]